ncbi:hypothetical protein [Sorangium sp. So ce388]|uniref:hypothetical protein n=1 Tax=Sorangium sp. So ce388 TaxID=3133309 RepID=UPI003F5C9BDD
MSHFAMTRDEIQVIDWTGDVPRVGETMMVSGNGQHDYRGRWKVVDVLWMMRTSVTGTVPGYAEVKVDPADKHARAWLRRKHAEREQEA